MNENKTEKEKKTLEVINNHEIATDNSNNIHICGSIFTAAEILKKFKEKEYKEPEDLCNEKQETIETEILEKINKEEHPNTITIYGSNRTVKDILETCDKEKYEYVKDKAEQGLYYTEY